jgi:hypothetical protein
MLDAPPLVDDPAAPPFDATPGAERAELPPAPPNAPELPRAPPLSTFPAKLDPLPLVP